MSFLVIFSCLQGLPNLLSVSSNTGDTLGPFLVSPLLWKSSWLDSTHIWSLGFLLPKRNMFCLIFSPHICGHFITFLFQEQDPSVGQEKHPPVDGLGIRDRAPYPISRLLVPQRDLGTAAVRQALWCLQLPCCFFFWFSQIPAVGPRAEPATMQPRAAGVNWGTWTCSIWELKGGQNWAQITPMLKMKERSLPAYFSHLAFI